jgi:hypothetical protein
MRRLVIVLAIALAFCGAVWSRTPKQGVTKSAQPTGPEPTGGLRAMRAAAPDSLKLQNAAVTPPDSTYEEYMRNRKAEDDHQASEAAPSDIEPSPSRFSLQVNLDFTNSYFYHGIRQQDEGLIVQPGAELAINIPERDDFRIDALLGTWNSFGRNGGTKTGGVINDWYEADLYAGFTITKGKLSLTTTYTFFTSPSDAYHTIEELDFLLEYDDSELLGKFALHPYLLLGLETGADGSDGADLDRGTYLEIGIAPGFSFDVEKTPVTVTFPISVGLSIDDYYQDAAGDDDTFGFVQAGVNASFPLPFGDRFGSWTLNTGAALMYLGDHTSEFNGGDDTEFIATIGVQLNF